MRTSQLYKEKKLCTGCEACLNICPKQAITMKENWQGFMYPQINKSLCINCKLCQKTCPTWNPYKGEFKFTNAIAYVDSNENFLLQSSSGGAFGTLARHILQKGGIVFGVSMNNNYDIKYIYVDKLDCLSKLHGSKYVQTKVGHIYNKVKINLEKGKLVLFSGCPCHIAALNNYLKVQYKNLITIDLICHGVPSQKYFKDYVHDLLQKSKYDNFLFRYKRTSNNIYVGFKNRDYFMTYFLWGKGYRDSCYNCRYAGEKRYSDITIGDFWNNKYNGFPINEEKGASLIIFNTEKGKSFKEIFISQGDVYEINSLEKAVGKNGSHLKHHSKNDIRTFLIYILYKLLGIKGPKLLFKINELILNICQKAKIKD